MALRAGVNAVFSSIRVLHALLEGYGHQVIWWLRALVDWGDPRSSMGGKRLILLLVGMPLFFLVQLGHIVFLLLDEILFPRHRSAPIVRPLFILGIPRSGTTYIHRTLAAGEGFVTVTTWEALLAPSIVQRRLIRGLARLDRGLGAPGARMVTWLSHRMAGGLEDVHAVEPSAAEEDYLLLLPAGGCFLLTLALPGRFGPAQLGWLDQDLSPGRRRRLLFLYRRLLQRHIHAHGNSGRLLSKNAAFGGWIAGLRDTFPDARFLISIREPTAALSSQISAIADAGARFGTATDSVAFQRLFLAWYEATLSHLAETVSHWPAETAVILDMAELRAAPGALLVAALERLGEGPDPARVAQLMALPSGGRSPHRHAVDELALDGEELRARLLPPYQRLCDDLHYIEAAR